MITVENTYRASEAAVVQLVLFAVVAAAVIFETAVEDMFERHLVTEMFQPVAGSEATAVAAAVEETSVVVDSVEVVLAAVPVVVAAAAVVVVVVVVVVLLVVVV